MNVTSSLCPTNNILSTFSLICLCHYKYCYNVTRPEKLMYILYVTTTFVLCLFDVLDTVYKTLSVLTDYKKYFF